MEPVGTTSLAPVVYGLAEASQVLGVSVDTLRNRIKSGQLPEATMNGRSYEIPVGDLGAIAEREGWNLTLPTTSPMTPVGDVVGISEKLADARGDLRVAEVELERLRTDASKDLRRIEQLSSDIEQRESEIRRLGHDAAELDKAKAVAEARTDEIRRQLLETTEESRRRIERLSAELSDAQNHATAVEAQRLAAEAQAAEAAAQRDQARAAMGWWSRRRFEKRLER